MPETMPQEDTFEEIERLFKKEIIPLTQKWQDAQENERQLQLKVIDTVAEVVMRDMVYAGEGPLGTKYFLKKEYIAFFKEKGVASSNAARFPFNSPFKYALYQDWVPNPQDDETRKRQENAEAYVSVFSAIAAFAYRDGVKPSDKIAEHGSIKDAKSEADAVMRADKLTEERAEAKEKQRKIDEQKAANRRAEEERKKAEAEAKAKLDEEAKAAEQARRDQAELDRKQKALERDVEKAAAERRAAEEKARAARRAQDDLIKRQERLEKERAEAEKRAAEMAEENKRKEAELKKAEEEAAKRKIEEEKEAAKRVAEAKRIATQSKKQVAVTKSEEKPRKLSVSKDRDEVLRGIERAWILVEKRGKEWVILHMEPAPAEIGDDTDEGKVKHLPPRKKTGDQEDRQHTAN